MTASVRRLGAASSRAVRARLAPLATILALMPFVVAAAEVVGTYEIRGPGTLLVRVEILRNGTFKYDSVSCAEIVSASGCWQEVQPGLVLATPEQPQEEPGVVVSTSDANRTEVVVADEFGQPVPEADVFLKCGENGQYFRTDQKGTISVKPCEAERVVVTKSGFIAASLQRPLVGALSIRVILPHWKTFQEQYWYILDGALRVLGEPVKRLE